MVAPSVEESEKEQRHAIRRSRQMDTHPSQICRLIFCVYSYHDGYSLRY